MVGSGDRSERIRTYNFPQGRVTDHRINLTLHRLPEILEGQLDELIGALIAEDEAERLASLDDDEPSHKPSPLMGEGWVGVECSGKAQAVIERSPHPNPSPSRGGALPSAQPWPPPRRGWRRRAKRRASTPSC